MLHIDVFDECALTHVEGRYQEYLVAIARENNVENNELVLDACVRLTPSGVKDFIRQTQDNLAPGVSTKVLLEDGVNNLLQTVDEKTAIGVSSEFFNREAAMVMTMKFPITITDPDQPDFALIVAGFDAVMDVDAADRVAILQALIDRRDDQIVAGHRICLQDEEVVWLFNASWRCDNVPGYQG